MLSIRKMQKADVAELFDIALRSFRPDYEKYGMYPPLLNLKSKSFFPPQMFGKVILADDKIVGGAFVVGFGNKGEIGAIFLDPNEQRKGYGKQAMLMFEDMYPKVKKWRLDTPAESYGLHRFYETLGYIKVGEMNDRGMRGFKYEKTISG